MTGHTRTLSVDRATTSTRFLPHLGWFRGGTHGRSQSLDGPPRTRTVLHRRSRPSLDSTPRETLVPPLRPPPLHRMTSTSHLQPRSPVITSGRMLHRKAASMDTMSNLYTARPFPLTLDRREQAIEQTRRWQRELDAIDARWTTQVAPRHVEGAGAAMGDGEEPDLSQIWDSFVGHLEESISVLGVDDRDLLSSSSDTDSEAPVTPELGYLEPSQEVLVGLGLGYLSWSGQAADRTETEPRRAPHRCSPLAESLSASFSSTEAVLWNSNSSWRKSKGAAFVGLALTNDASAPARPRKRSVAYPNVRLSRVSGVPTVTIHHVDDHDTTVCYGQAY